MGINSKQERMNGIDMIPTLKFRDMFNDLCVLKGQGTIADEIGMDPGAFSRFKSGDGGISMKQLEALLAQADVVITPTKEIKMLMMSVFTFVDMLKKSVGW
jgi:hypothetical protein